MTAAPRRGESNEKWAAMKRKSEAHLSYVDFDMSEKFKPRAARSWQDLTR